MRQTAIEDPNPDTKTALLDAAERLFASKGVAESSLRAITAAAGANLASVNYHFGSKMGLVQAVFARRLSTLNRKRLDLLDRCEAADGDGVAELRCLLKAFVRPAVEMMLSEDTGDRKFAKLLGRTLFEPTNELRPVILEQFREVGERFTEALARMLPDVPPEEILWRFHFMVGSLVHSVAGRDLVSHRLQCLELPDDDDIDRLTTRLVSFLETGWSGIADDPDRAGSRPSARHENVTRGTR